MTITILTLRSVFFFCLVTKVEQLQVRIYIYFDKNKKLRDASMYTILYLIIF